MKKIKTKFHSLLTCFRLHLCPMLLSLDQEKHKNDISSLQRGVGKINGLICAKLLEFIGQGRYWY